MEKFGKGFLVLLGVTHDDTKEKADYLVKKLCKLRVFTEEELTKIPKGNLIVRLAKKLHLL